MNDSRIFGWDLPPGVTSKMLDEMYGPEPTPQFRCGRCQRWLAWEPDRTEQWEDGIECDGKTVEYVVPYPPEVRERLGIEAETYTERLAPCGQCVDHEAHKEIMAAGVREFRRCAGCGHVTEVES